MRKAERHSIIDKMSDLYCIGKVGPVLRLRDKGNTDMRNATIITTERGVSA